jgi:hypothetical protein
MDRQNAQKRAKDRVAEQTAQAEAVAPARTRDKRGGIDGHQG